MLSIILLAGTQAWAEPLTFEVNEFGNKGVVMTIGAPSHELVPIVGSNGRDLSILSHREIFLVKRAGVINSAIENLEQVRETGSNRIMVKFERPMQIRGEGGKLTTRLVAQPVEESEESPRGSLNLRIVPASLAGNVADDGGITIVIPDLGNFGFSPLSTILRGVAFGLDWTQRALPPLWGSERQVSNEQELQALVRNLNLQVIELRRQVMLKDEELRANKRVGL